MQVRQRLDVLTTLRFIAAALIVIYHSGGLFGLSSDPHKPFSLGQGVSFFFVLSGFILAYVYPTLNGLHEIQRFLRARVARIWPGLFASFIFAYWLLSLSWSNPQGVANLLMINAWIPLPSYFFSYNAPSWSISTEFFFYLAFPFFIYRWEGTWKFKLVISMSTVALLIAISNLLNLPTYDGTNVVSRSALLYIHPASRIFEFIFGIYLAFKWKEKASQIKWSEGRATLYEVGATVVVAVSMHLAAPFAEGAAQTWLGTATAEWLYGSGSMLAFGLLIFVMATGRGRISAWLSHPALVVLGEISFALYLLHQIFLRYYRMNVDYFPHLSNELSIAIFWVVLLLASYLMWALIEMPGRRLILGGKGKMHGTLAMRKSWTQHLNLNRKTVLAAAVLAAILSSIYFSMGNINRINASDANALSSKDTQAIVGARFGNLFVLRGVRVLRKVEGIQIDLAWESLIAQKLVYTNGIHLTNSAGIILVQADYKQPMSRLIEKEGSLWMDSILIPANKLTGQESKLAIALYQHSSNLLPIDRGDRDWGGHRLLIDLPLNVSTDH